MAFRGKECAQWLHASQPRSRARNVRLAKFHVRSTGSLHCAWVVMAAEINFCPTPLGRRRKVESRKPHQPTERARCERVVRCVSRTRCSRLVALPERRWGLAISPRLRLDVQLGAGADFGPASDTLTFTFLAWPKRLSWGRWTAEVLGAKLQSW